jgi:hypothetical protein
VALALLHDNGIRGADWSKPAMALLTKAGVTDDRCEWVPYWRSAPVAKAKAPGVLISAYQNAGKGLTTLVVVNPTKAPIETDITLGVAPGSATDAETDAAVALAGKKLSKLAIPAHDFRLVMLTRR